MERGSGEGFGDVPGQPERPARRRGRSEEVERILFALALDKKGGNVFIPAVSEEFVRERLRHLMARVRRIQSGEEEFNDNVGG